MLKNAVKGIIEHHKKDPLGIYATLDEGIPPPSEFSKSETTHLTFTCQAYEAQGKRKTMEDAHFFTEFDHGVLCGVFDGHGGKDVAIFASNEFTAKFPKELLKAKGNVHQAFEALIHKIHTKVAKNKKWNFTGSTAVITYIDKSSHNIYTATLGDSEANIYRTIGAGIRSLPLSIIRDWSSHKDATRAAIARNKPSFIKEYMETENPKWLRFPSALGVNVSRAIGDNEYSGTSKKPGVIHKPKITINKLKQGDFLVLACDGLKDFVNEREIAGILAANSLQPASNLAEQLVKFALDEKKSNDNVTALVVRIN